MTSSPLPTSSHCLFPLISFIKCLWTKVAMSLKLAPRARGARSPSQPSLTLSTLLTLPYYLYLILKINFRKKKFQIFIFLIKNHRDAPYSIPCASASTVFKFSLLNLHMYICKKTVGPFPPNPIPHGPLHCPPLGI